MKQNVSVPTPQSGKCLSATKTPNPEAGRHTVEQLLKWAPLLSLVVLDAAGKQQQEKLEKHFIDLAAATLIMNATLLPAQLLSCNRSSTAFAGRSAAAAFLGSEMLRQELAPRHGAWSYAGYLLAAGATALKAKRNGGGWSKAIAGAAIGILAVKLTPLLLDKIIARINIQQAVY